jgi:FkbM family methyltransferase
MKTYSQNQEDLKAAGYFDGLTGTLLSVGENDGRTFSNALLMIEKGWKAHLFEPGRVCDSIFRLHRGNKNVHIYNKGMGKKAEVVRFYESGAHVKGGSDKGLVSTTDYKETIKWRKAGVQFTSRNVQIVDFKGWYKHAGEPKLHLISLDTEGHDWTILQEIDLRKVGCEFLIIEWNSDKSLARKITEYCAKFGLVEHSRNPENLLFYLPLPD